MINTRVRTTALEALYAPPGYHFDQAVISTFTLSLEAVFTIPIAIQMGEMVKHEQNEQPTQFSAMEKISFIDAVRNIQDRLMIFHQEDAISKPAFPNVLFSFLEKNLIPVTMTSGVFHPKVWIIRFKSKRKEEWLYRILVLSRNLTFDPSWDSAIVLEGKYSEQNKSSSIQNKELLDFLRWLQTSQYTQQISSEQKANIESIVVQLSFTELQIPVWNGKKVFDTMKFRFFSSNPTSNALIFPQKYSRILAISPFLHKSQVQQLCSHRKEGGALTLVARQSQLQQLDEECLKHLKLTKSCFMPKRVDDFIVENLSIFDSPRGLHAKILGLENDKKVRWIIGSSNLTTAGWNGRNIELNLEFETSKDSPFTIENLWPCGEEKIPIYSFRFLCERYSRPLDDTTTLEEEIRKDLGKVRRTLRRPMTVIWQQSSNTLELKIVAREKPNFDFHRIQIQGIHIYPITIEKETVQMTNILESIVQGTEKTLLFSLETQKVTKFFAIDIEYAFFTSIDSDIRVQRTETMIKQLNIEGLDSARREQLIIQDLLIKKPENLFSFLQKILGQKSVYSKPKENDQPRDSSGHTTELDKMKAILSGLDIFEHLIQLAAENPQKLQLIQEALKGMKEEEIWNNPMMQDFVKLWKAIEPLLPQNPSIGQE